MKLSDIKPGQKVNLNGIIAEYQGIQKVRIPNFGKVEKRVFRADETGDYLYYNLNEGSKTLKSEKIKLL
ncbi:hypothetical protein BEI02_15540 [Elizabethkingia sp. HvH-WGS333]|uniref:Uncharacterized protein n=1 Tax=Elizabethkingia anophelis TaxID=1117645 RepID=A0A455ZGF8_9FLAO|nr:MULTISPECIES: hypothetical protein [Elizabethkingia]MCL1641529.1 hypothetical protein [Elizabethkingia anophelis]MCL1646340.1 hypothetical protein [Elizabethkingia anophelis]MDV3473028.1 hypothetical protein [Elizabethkingia anophelis]OIK46299.1 hypothetical protein BEI02_15540 [Elizabethkingia sp. HvH-WGS333]DAC75943.1 TPA_exp: hypothetical protein [Elizabethkingia anophelis]